jgi:hypothetical protein
VTRRLSRVLVCGALAVALAGCSGDSDDPAEDSDASGSSSAGGSASGSGSSSASPSSSIAVPDGVELTEQGASLDVGETATVAYQLRQNAVGVLDITVTRLEKTSFAESFVGWDLSDQTKSTKPYFVRATVLNRGVTDLAGLRLQPLYALDATDTLVESTIFESTFKPCHPNVFPEPFPAGSTVDLCLVYLVPNKGELVSASFRPTETDVPITWSGELQKPEPPKGDKDKKDRGKGKGGNRDNQG